MCNVVILIAIHELWTFMEAIVHWGSRFWCQKGYTVLVHLLCAYINMSGVQFQCSMEYRIRASSTMVWTSWLEYSQRETTFSDLSGINRITLCFLLLKKRDRWSYHSHSFFLSLHIILFWLLFSSMPRLSSLLSFWFVWIDWILIIINIESLCSHLQPTKLN